MLEMLTRNPSEREKKIIPLWFGMFFWRGQFEMAIFGFPTYFYPMTEYFNAQWFQRPGSSYLIKIWEFLLFLVNFSNFESWLRVWTILGYFESFWDNLSLLGFPTYFSQWQNIWDTWAWNWMCQCLIYAVLSLLSSLLCGDFCWDGRPGSWLTRGEDGSAGALYVRGLTHLRFIYLGGFSGKEECFLLWPRFSPHHRG